MSISILPWSDARPDVIGVSVLAVMSALALAADVQGTVEPDVILTASVRVRGRRGIAPHAVVGSCVNAGH